ncbi:alpha-amylase family glycosyl hydrolase [Oerskovia sp. M15]
MVRESVTYGDFDGLDDLMTENPRVVDGFVDVYQGWVDLGIDGFRIDTVKHVNFEFWETWTTEVLDYAHAKGKDDFFMFGEIYDADAAKLRRTSARRTWARCWTSRSSPRPQASRAGTAPRACPSFRERRHVHDARLLCLGTADLPRQPRHGPHRVPAADHGRRPAP